jgi:hypothetical protein
MPSQRSKLPKSTFAQSFNRFFTKTVERLNEWQAQQQEAERKAVANAKFPWLETLQLLALHICLGLLLAALSGAWAIAAGVFIIGVSLYCSLLAVGVDSSLWPDSLICFLVLGWVAQPWQATAEKLDLVLRRWILSTFQGELAIDFWKVVASVFCLVVLVGLSGLGLRVGYWLGTQFW